MSKNLNNAKKVKKLQKIEKIVNIFEKDIDKIKKGEYDKQNLNQIYLVIRILIETKSKIKIIYVFRFLRSLYVPLLLSKHVIA